MTASSDSSTGPPARLRRRPLPWRHFTLLLLFLAGVGASLVGLVRLRQPLLFEAFTVGENPAVPIERVRLRERGFYPVHFLLIHGHAANRRQLLHLAEVLAVASGDVYLLDLPGRGDHHGPASPRTPTGLHAAMPTPRETQAALAVVRQLESQFRVRRERLVVVGHSLGGGVALDVGRQVAPLATISLAGLERLVAPGRPRNLLLITARLEIPALRQAADRMHERARAGRSPDQSLLGRGEFPATHASLPWHSAVQRAIVDWTNRALPGARLAIALHFNERLLALEWLGLFCLAGLFVPLSHFAGWASAHEPFGEVVPESRFSFWSLVHLGGYALLAGAAAVSAIRLLEWFGWPHPLSFLHLDGGDYLASFLLFATLWLLPVLAVRLWVRSWRETAAKVGIAAVLAAYIIVIGGGFTSWQLFDLWPTSGHLLRMLLLVVLLLPYALGEELLVRTFSKQRGTSALGGFLAWRVGLLAAILYGVWGLGSADVLLVLLALPLLLLSLVEHFFAETLYRALGSVYATTVVHLTLMSWIIATVFPLR